MTILLSSLLLVAISTLGLSQNAAKWYRVYTLDDSHIDMDTANAELGGTSSVRVTFRWTFDRGQVLDNQSKLLYNKRLEVMNIDCDKRRYWIQEIKFVNSSGKVISENTNRSLDWRRPDNAITANQLSIGCELVKVRTAQPSAQPRFADDVERIKASETAFAFVVALQASRDVSGPMSRFFASNYLSGYLSDHSEDWFEVVKPEIAATAKREELQRFYEALLNNAYLGTLYLVAQSSSDSIERLPDEKVNTPRLVQFVRNHPYSAYKKENGGYDYLSERIESIERLRQYTTLLEGINSILRKEIDKLPSAEVPMLRHVSTDEQDVLPRAGVGSCTRSCLGLPAGTKIFAVDVFMFRLELAKIEGKMKIVSAKYSYE